MYGRFFAHNFPMECLETANGVYRILTPPGCALRPGAYERLRRAAHSGADFLYPDIERVTPNGQARTVRRPPWSPDTLLSMNYLDGPVAVRRALMADLGADAMRTPESRYAAVLLLTERAGRIRHVPEVLARCEAAPPCTDTSVLERALKRRHIPARVEQGRVPGTFVVRDPVPVHTRLSCIVTACPGAGDARRTLESIACHTLWRHVELIVADNRPILAATERYYAALSQYEAARVLRDPAETSVARLMNRAAEMARGDALLFLPAGTAVCGGDALTRMLEVALRRHVGAVGGVEAAARGIIHNVRALDGAVMLRTARFFHTGGFDESFSKRGAVRAFTLLNPDRGAYNVVTPFAAFEKSGRERPDPLTEINKLRIADMQSYAREETDAP